MKKRVAQVAGGAAVTAAATATALETIRRQRRAEARQIVLERCVVAVGGDGAAAARALDEHGCCVMLGALRVSLTEPGPSEQADFQTWAKSRLSRFADTVDPVAAVAAAGAAAAMLLPTVHIGDGHLTRHRAALGAQLAERAAITRWRMQAPTTAGCAQAANALRPVMEEARRALPTAAHDRPASMFLDLQSAEEEVRM